MSARLDIVTVVAVVVDNPKLDVDAVNSDEQGQPRPRPRPRPRIPRPSFTPQILLQEPPDQIFAYLISFFQLQLDRLSLVSLPCLLQLSLSRICDSSVLDPHRRAL